MSRHGREREHLGTVKMAARLALSSPLTNQIPVLSNPKSPSHNLSSPKTRPSHFRVQANSGGGDDGEIKSKGKRKFITREEEPEQYWQTAGEREGENPMKTPLPYIIIFGMSTPFVILAIAFANGWVKVPARCLIICVILQHRVPTTDSIFLLSCFNYKFINFCFGWLVSEAIKLVLLWLCNALLS
ncbi:uncharacterized protein LOC119999860 [Tripterygium wilfordii]|uniref:uncharacterized protein LOC119999860 n=1 Tax=Tripterygium wilfordii TaxID=458696 RepID=UPI0018F8185D|nr:uncharacterized protein LOC119999860 [Tripterygium wilfordii]